MSSNPFASFRPDGDQSANDVADAIGVQAVAFAANAKPPGLTGTVYGGTVADSGNQMIDALVWGDKWDNSHTITYFFDDGDSVSPWAGWEKAAFRDALQTWANVANINFAEVHDINAANLVEVKYADPTESHILGKSELPNPTNQVFQLFNVSGLNGFNLPTWTQDSLHVGGQASQIFVHELGHALGLAHPHDNGGGSLTFPGVTDINGDYGDNDLNQGVYTTMGYNQGYASVDGTNVYNTVSTGYSATPMPFDIAAIQYIYGANPHFHDGNDTYRLPTSNAPGDTWTGIYDTGGIDTIVNPGKAPSTISLVAATIDDSPTGGGEPSHVDGLLGGFTIAQNVLVENAIGGSGPDKIIGNWFGNTLDGNQGADAIYGAGGNDTIFGGLGTDTIYGDAAPAIDSGIGFGSGQIVDPTGNVFFDSALDITNQFSLAADPEIANSTTTPHLTISMTTVATGNVVAPWFAVTVNPGSIIYLDIDHTTNLDSSVFIWGSDGRGLAYSNDDFSLDPGSNSPQDSSLSFKAVDGGTYYIDVEDWNIIGGLPNNASFQLHVSVADPAPVGTDGTPGNDVIDGGPGNDVLFGGQGNDTFVFKPNSGSDVVSDFNIGNAIDHDTLNFTAFGFSSVSAFLLDVTDGPNGAVVQTDTFSVELLNVTKADLTSHGFDLLV